MNQSPERIKLEYLHFIFIEKFDNILHFFELTAAHTLFGGIYIRLRLILFSHFLVFDHCDFVGQTQGVTVLDEHVLLVSDLTFFLVLILRNVKPWKILFVSSVVQCIFVFFLYLFLCLNKFSKWLLNILGWLTAASDDFLYFIFFTISIFATSLDGLLRVTEITVLDEIISVAWLNRIVYLLCSLTFLLLTNSLSFLSF